MEVAREGLGFQYVGVFLPLEFSPWGITACSSLVCCSASLCPPSAVAVLFCLRTCVLLCPRISFLALSFGGGAVTEVLHDLRFGVSALSRTLLHLARRSDHLQACVCIASSHHVPCVPAIRLCVARPASALLALWPSCSACVRACCSVLGSPYLALSFGGGAVTEVLHDLRCGPALSLVRHDLPCNQKKI